MAAPGQAPLAPGSMVKGHHASGDWYFATVDRAIGQGRYEVSWLDGDPSDRLKGLEELRPMRFHADLGCYLEVGEESTQEGSGGDGEDWMERMVEAMEEEEVPEAPVRLEQEVDLLARMKTKVLRVTKPPPAVSFTEVWCHEYFLRRGEPRRLPKVAVAPRLDVGELLVATTSSGGVAAGTLVRVLERKDGVVRYELLAGTGARELRAPEASFATIAKGQVVELDRSTGGNARKWAPAQSCRAAAPATCVACRCRMAVGMAAGASLAGEALPLHAECLERLLRRGEAALCAWLEEGMEAEEVREEEKVALKRLLEMEGEMQRALRRSYGIGWREDMVPCGRRAAERLGLALKEGGLCCLAIDERARTVRLAKTRHPGVAVNLEYLATALRVLKDTGAQAFFSLDPVEPGVASSMLAKRFGPAWLAGSAAGELLFQADYYLKELSMGQFLQPLEDMASCWDLADENAAGPDWDARIWFVVREAEVNISEDDVLIPCVAMGVEARELQPGSAVDAAVTRRDHPLVRYAEAFAERFEAVAERVSVVYHLRELAKASALAKFLWEGGYEVPEAWLALGAEERPCLTEAPRLWRRRLAAEAEGAGALAAEEGRTNMLHGGVDLSMQSFAFPPRRVKALLEDVDKGREELRPLPRPLPRPRDRPLPDLLTY